MRADPPLRVGAATLVLVSRVVIRSDKGDAGCWIGAFKEPVAVIVRDARGERAFALDSSEIALDVLIDQTPGLDAILSEFGTS
ncbi:MAG: hypothetical protein JSU82_08715 [Rhodospirillales bacterium]|nr:MAG: hypothetical protein JSU82_08715 [Rhodospirillales bacterium]